MRIRIGMTPITSTNMTLRGTAWNRTPIRTAIASSGMHIGIIPTFITVIATKQSQIIRMAAILIIHFTMPILWVGKEYMNKKRYKFTEQIA